MNIRKRFIAYIMCYVLALSMIPAPVSGADGDGAGTETCEHEYKVLKYVWGYEAEGVWKDSLVNVASAQSPNETDFDANESWEGKTIQCKAVLACVLCHDEDTETVPAKISEDKEETFPATCQEKGKTTYIASFTNKSCEQQKEVKETSVDPTAHKYGALNSEIPATCTTEGKKEHYECELCNKYFDKNHVEITDITISVDATKHDYGTLNAKKEATCTTPGTKEHYECKFCKKYFDKNHVEIIDIIISELGHNYGQPIYNWGYEDANGNWQEMEADKDWPDDIVNDQRKCKAARSCQNEGCSELDVKMKTAVMSSQTPSNCTNVGEKTYAADFEADFGESVVRTIKIAINPNSHSLTKTEAKAVSCTADGISSYYTCKMCHHYFSDAGGQSKILPGSWVIHATGHDIAEEIEDRTNTKEGCITRSCKKCGFLEEKLALPPKKLTIYPGEEKAIFENTSIDASKYMFTLPNAKKYKKYFSLDSATGKVIAEWSKKSKKPVDIKKTIPVNVTVAGTTYPVKVKIEIPKPKINIKRKKMSGGWTRYIFKYNIKNATKIEVRANLKGVPDEYYDKWLRKPKSNKDSYVTLYLGAKKKIKFTIIAYYGANVSKKTVITK